MRKRRRIGNQISLGQLLAINSTAQARKLIANYGLSAGSSHELVKQLNYIIREYGEEALHDMAQIHPDVRSGLLVPAENMKNTAEVMYVGKPHSNACGQKGHSNACGCNGHSNMHGEHHSNCSGHSNYGGLDVPDPSSGFWGGRRTQQDIQRDQAYTKYWHDRANLGVSDNYYHADGDKPRAPLSAKDMLGGIAVLSALGLLTVILVKVI